MKELLEICTELKKQGLNEYAMATVVHVEGSSYRRPGARMLITPTGETWGMISGGCLEHDVLHHAQRTLKSGEARVVRYDSTSADDTLFGTGLGCNGIIDVFIEPVTGSFRGSFICAVEKCRDTRQFGAIVAVVGADRNLRLVGQHAFLECEDWLGSEELLSLLPPLDKAKETILTSDSAPGSARLFIQSLQPPIQLVIFGGWFDVLPLIRMAREIGFQTIVVDTRQRPSSNRFAGTADSVLLCSPAEVVQKIHFDVRTVAVLMNHNFENDHEALAALAPLTLPFVGILGPQRRKQKLLDALQENGVLISEEFLQSLHGPVGLDLGAKTPEEIALSIMAEILSVLNQRNAKPIRDRLTPLHTSIPSLAYA